MEQNPTKLREKMRVGEFHSIMRGVGFAGAVLFPFFWLADCFYSPENKWTFLAMRLGVSFGTVITTWLVLKSQALKRIHVLASINTFIFTFPITAMIYMTEGATSPYYTGLNLCSIVICFLPWRRNFLYLNLAIIYIPYLAMSVIDFFQGVTVDLVVNNTFIAGFALAFAVVRHFTESLRKETSESRHQLYQEIDKRNQIIKVKTEQSVQLKELAKQFSPQIVDAIAEGKITLQGELHIKKICALFIDIVDSTKRMLERSPEEVNRVLNMFLDDAINTLLKYNITIDKFMGDGILGFCNDPISQEDYVERVLEACFEIIHRLEVRAEEYKKYWGDPLTIHVGVAEGLANIGFYGSAGVKSYTAIGKVMNLASRLSSSSAPNQVLICESVQKIIENSEKSGDYLTLKMSNVKLKGFNQSNRTVYQIMNTRQDSKIGDFAICPHGHGVLHLSQDHNGLYAFKCRSCGYMMEDGAIDTVPKKRAA